MRLSRFAGKFLFYLIISTFCILPARAIDTRELLRYKHWMVSVVAFDDSSLACEAKVVDVDNSFSIWTYPDKSVELQFYLGNEWFGDSESQRDITLRIDRRTPWDLSNASFYQSSIFFMLPSQNWDAAVEFLREVKRGNRIYLFNQYGEQKTWFSLSGSSAAVNKLAECQDLIKADSGW